MITRQFMLSVAVACFVKAKSSRYSYSVMLAKTPDCVSLNVGFGWWSQLIVATLYLKGNRWSVRDDETEATKVFG